MSFKFHEVSLGKICRTCTNRLHPGSKSALRKPVLCESVRKEISNVFGVSTWLDVPDQHPSKLCEKCTRKIRHYNSGKTYSIHHAHQQTIQTEWPKHSRTGKCFACDIVKTQAKGGGSRKRKFPDVYTSTTSLCFDSSVTNIFANLPSQSCSVPPNIDIIGHQGEESFFICVICQCVISRPAVQTSCEHVFCATCLSSCFKTASCREINCPTCNCIVDYGEVAKIPRILNVQLDNLTVVCNKCNKIGKLSLVVDHECSPIKPQEHRVTIVKSSQPIPLPHDDSAAVKVRTAARVLKELASTHQVGAPIPMEVEEVTDKWTWFKLKQKSVVSIKTGGRVSSSSTSIKKTHTKLKSCGHCCLYLNFYIY